VSTVYDAFSVSPVTVGAAPFDGSFAQQTVPGFDGNITYHNLAFSNTFVTNTQFSIRSTPITCPGLCDSYIFPGAVWSLNITLPTNSSDDTVVKIGRSPAIQLDFVQNVDSGDAFLPHECIAYGERGSKIGIELCLTRSKVHKGSIVAGVYSQSPSYPVLLTATLGVSVCDQILEDGSCLFAMRDPPRINTTFSLYSLTASTACIRTNNSIISVTDTGEPILEQIDIYGLDLALNWLLNYTAQGIPAMSSLVFMFWHGDHHPAARHDWSTATYLSLKSILAYSIWMFSVNNVGDPLKPTRLLPSEFETSTSLCRPLEKIVVDPGAFVAYVVLQSTVILFFWLVAIWRWNHKYPIQNLSCYPLVDFAAKFVRKEVLPESDRMWQAGKHFLRDAGSKEVIDGLRETRLIRQAEDGDHWPRRLHAAVWASDQE
jgi:hypothetical protein